MMLGLRSTRAFHIDYVTTHRFGIKAPTVHIGLFEKLAFAWQYLAPQRNVMGIPTIVKYCR